MITVRIILLVIDTREIRPHVMIATSLIFQRHFRTRYSRVISIENDIRRIGYEQ